MYLAFPGGDNWYLVQHDALSDIAAETTPWLRSPSWIKGGQYGVAEPSKQMLDRLSDYTLGLGPSGQQAKNGNGKSPLPGAPHRSRPAPRMGATHKDEGVAYDPLCHVGGPS